MLNPKAVAENRGEGCMQAWKTMVAAGLTLAFGIVMPSTFVAAQQAPSQPSAAAAAAVALDSDDIGGIVTSRFGPEAGVWVIAETTELGTRFAKSVGTDELDRYVIP